MLPELEYLLDLPDDIKLELIIELWLSMENEYLATDAPNLPPEKIAEYWRRLAEMRDDPSLGISIAELWERFADKRSQLALLHRSNS